MLIESAVVGETHLLDQVALADLSNCESGEPYNSELNCPLAIRIPELLLARTMRPDPCRVNSRLLPRLLPDLLPDG